MEVFTNSCKPGNSSPARLGLNIISGAMNLSGPTLITLPSGRLYSTSIFYLYISIPSKVSKVVFKLLPSGILENWEIFSLIS